MADSLPLAPATADDEPALQSRKGNPQLGSIELKAAAKIRDAQIRHLAAQPTVKVKVPKGGLSYSINGAYQFFPEGRHEVPEQVAELWEETGRI